MSTIAISSGLHADAYRHLRELVGGRYEVVRLHEDGSSPGDTANAEILLWCERNSDNVPKILSGSPSLRWIHACTGGVDQLRHPAIVGRDLIVTRSPNAAAIPVSEWVLAGMLTVAKRFGHSERMQAANLWNPADPTELFGSTVVIVGTGAIGRRVGSLARDFGMKAIGVSRSAEPLEQFERVVGVSKFDDLIAQCDFLVLSCPLTSETRGLIGATQLAAMKSSAFLINVARGPVVVEADLIGAVKSGEIAGAFLDVFDEEPIPLDSALWDIEGIRITPHSAWRSTKAHKRAVDDFAANLSRFEERLPLSGVEPSIVNAEIIS